MKSTIDDVPQMELGRPPWGRRVGTAILALFIGSGAIGLLGDSVHTKTAAEAGYTLTLTYPKSSRAGQDVPWALDISSTTPLPPQITVAVTGDYFNIFEQQGLDPEATSQTADDEMEYWTFNTPENNTMSISIDHYVEPGVMRGASGTVGLYIDGQVVAPIDFTTRMLP